MYQPVTGFLKTLLFYILHDTHSMARMENLLEPGRGESRCRGDLWDSDPFAYAASYILAGNFNRIPGLLLPDLVVIVAYNFP